MRVAYSADRTARYALAGATPAEQIGAVLLGPDQARAWAREGRLHCADPHCEHPVTYTHATEYAPYWGHRPGTAAGCAVAGREGAWHRYVTGDLLGAAYAHEYVVPGARADVIVARLNTQRRFALEAQASWIDMDTFRRRVVRHADSGLVATVWALHGLRVARGIDPTTWATGSGPRLEITTSWAAELLIAAAEYSAETGYPVPVGLLVETPTGHVLRIVDRIEVVTTVRGVRTVTVTSWTDAIPEHVLRDWCAGPDRVLDQATEPLVRTLDMAPERRVKVTPHPYTAKMSSDRKRVRLMLTTYQEPGHRDVIATGKRLGLTWAQGRETYRDGTRAVAGRLYGSRTSEIETWLESLGAHVILADAA